MRVLWLILFLVFVVVGMVMMGVIFFVILLMLLWIVVYCFKGFLWVVFNVMFLVRLIGELLLSVIMLL